MTNDAPYAPQQTFATVQVSGPEAEAFLQSLTCNDVTQLTAPEVWQWNGLCTAKGRLIALFWLSRPAAAHYQITIDVESAEFLQATLLKYRFRRKVTIELGEARSGPSWATFIAEGWPWIVPVNREQFLPQWVNLDLLGGVSFQKGCYPGQEIVARTRYLGEVKRRMVKVVGAGAIPEAGAPCFSRVLGEQAVGRVVLAAPDASGFVALVSLLKTAAQEGVVQVGSPEGVEARIVPLPYPLDEGSR